METKQSLILKATLELINIQILCRSRSIAEKKWTDGDPDWVLRTPIGRFGSKSSSREGAGKRQKDLLTTVNNDIKSFFSDPSVKKGLAIVGVLGLGALSVQVYQGRLNATNEEPFDFGSIKDDDEFLSKILAYSDATTKSEPLNNELKRRGMVVKDVIDNSETGFKAWAIDSLKGNTSALVFTGTELTPGNLNDIKDDVVGNVGDIQYAYGKNYIEAYLSARPGKDVGFIGHSLGGAIAQMAGVDYSDRIQKVTTFNSPGIPIKYQGKIDKIKNKQQVVHHITEDDIVSTAGDIFLPGKVKIRKSSANLFENHVGLINDEVDYPFDKLNSDDYKASFLSRKEQRDYRKMLQPGIMNLLNALPS